MSGGFHGAFLLEFSIMKDNETPSEFVSDPPDVDTKTAPLKSHNPLLMGIPHPNRNLLEQLTYWN